MSGRTADTQRRPRWRAPLLLSLWVGLASTAALAATPEEEVAAARDALIRSKPADALGRLTAAESAAAGLTSVVTPSTLAKLSLYRGVAYRMQKDSKGRDMEAWRQALVFDLQLVWDEGALKNDEAQDLFEALRAEVRDRKKVDPAVPEATGAAKIFVDGQRVKSGDKVLEGRHLGQITCPDGVTHGAWTDFAKPVKWFKMCPGGVDTAVVVAEAPVEDEWGDVGPAFGAPVAEPPPPAVTKAAPAKTAPAKTEPVAKVGEPVAKVGEPVEVDGGVGTLGEDGVLYVRRKIHWPLIIGAGALGLGAGGLHYLAVQGRQDYLDPANPDIRSTGDLDDLRTQTNRRETASIALAGLSAGVYVAAFIQW